MNLPNETMTKVIIWLIFILTIIIEVIIIRKAYLVFTTPTSSNTGRIITVIGMLIVAIITGIMMLAMIQRIKEDKEFKVN